MYKALEGLNLEEIENGQENRKPGASGNPWLRQTKVETHFADGMVENFHLKRRSAADFFVSVLGHSFVVALLILVPLLYTQAISTPQFDKILIAAPPPPPPPPPPALHVVERTPKSFFNKGKLFAPKFIPKQIAQVKEEAPPAPAETGVPGGVLGGIPGGQLGGVLGGILGGRVQAVPPPPPAVPLAHAGPYHVGGKVRPPQLITKVSPTYPTLAKMARVQGDVVIDSVIDMQGKVTQMKVVSGSPLLIPAALQALEQWQYQPTLLNGQPISVDMVVTVHFQLDGQAS